MSFNVKALDVDNSCRTDVLNWWVWDQHQGTNLGRFEEDQHQWICENCEENKN